VEDGIAEGRQPHQRPRHHRIPATTFVVPDGFETTIDKHRLFHLKEVK
jgi:hypothetical protein